jgi:branched-chain amino acid transport system substrate-binding protein
MDNKNSKIIISIILIACLTGLGLWTFTTQEITKSSALESIKLGVTLPLTGELASLGLDSRYGIEAGIKDFEKNNNTKVIVEFQNDECKGALTTNNVTKFVNVDKVNGIIGPLCSGAGMAGMPIANNGKTVMISGSTSASSISELGDYIFRTFPSDAIAGKKAAEYIYNTKGLKKTSIVYSNNEYGKGMSEVFSKTYQALGGNIVTSSGFEETSTDFSTEITKIIDNKAEALFFPTYPNNANSFLKQASDKGLNIYTLGTDSVSGQEVIGAGNFEGKDIILPKSDFSVEANKEIAKLLGQDENKTYGLYTFTNYDATKALLEAIKRANTTDSEKIKIEMYKTDFIGKSIQSLKFDNAGDVINPIYQINEVKNKAIIPKVIL